MVTLGGMGQDVRGARTDALIRLGSAIRGLRNEARLSQEGLAEALGVSRSTVRRIEGGQTDFRSSTLLAIAAALGTTLEEIGRRARVDI